MRRCTCPCDCGCEEPHFLIADSGQCPDCDEDNHEFPPPLVWTGEGWGESPAILALVTLDAAYDGR